MINQQEMCEFDTAVVGRPELSYGQWLLPALSCFLLCASALPFFHKVVTDDAYIGYRYAENIANGHGFVFNLGERVEGYSNFSWMLLLAGLAKLNVDLVVGGKVLSLLFGVATIFALQALANQVAPARRATNGIAGLLLASSSPFILWSVSGMETTLYTFLVVLALWLHLREQETGTGQVFSALALIGVALTRPEGVMWFALLAGLQLKQLFSARQLPNRHLVMWGATFLVLFAIYFAWRYSYFGAALPNPIHAKSGGGSRRILFGLKYVRDFVRENESCFFYVLAIVPFALGSTANAYGLRLIALGCAAISALTVYAGGDWMLQYRFLVPLMPLAYLLTVEGAAQIRDVVIARSRYLLPRVALAAVVIAGIADVRLSAFRNTLDRLKEDNVKWHEYERLGLWMRENLPSGAVVALGSAGLIPYYSQLKIIDMYGLMDLVVARHGTSAQEGHIFTKTHAKYVLSRSPDYILLYGHVADNQSLEGTTPYSEDMLRQPDFSRLYEMGHRAYRSAACPTCEEMVLFKRRSASL